MKLSGRSGMHKTTVFRNAVIVLTGSLFLAAAALADIPRQRVDIPAGDLSKALMLLSKQYGFDFFYRPEQVHGLQTKGAHGEMTQDEAVQRLIEGTELKMSTDASGAMVIGVPDGTSEKLTKRIEGNTVRMAEAN